MAAIQASPALQVGRSVHATSPVGRVLGRALEHVGVGEAEVVRRGMQRRRVTPPTLVCGEGQRRRKQVESHVQASVPSATGGAAQGGERTVLQEPFITPLYIAVASYAR